MTELSLKRPRAQSLFSKVHVIHPRRLRVSSPKTICIDPCGCNFHFDKKLGRLGVISRLL